MSVSEQERGRKERERAHTAGLDTSSHLISNLRFCTFLHKQMDAHSFAVVFKLLFKIITIIITNVKNVEDFNLAVYKQEV